MNGSVKKDNTILDILKKFRNILSYLEDKITIICFLGMTLAVLYGIVMRYFLRLPNQFGEEISRYLLVVCVFVGIGLVEEKNGNMKVDLFINIIPERAARVIGILSRIIVIVSYIWLSVISAQYVVRIYTLHQLSTSLKIPMFIMDTVLLIGFILGAVQTSIQIYIEYFTNDNTNHDTTNENIFVD